MISVYAITEHSEEADFRTEDVHFSYNTACAIWRYHRTRVDCGCALLQENIVLTEDELALYAVLLPHFIEFTSRRMAYMTIVTRLGGMVLIRIPDREPPFVTCPVDNVSSICEITFYKYRDGFTH